MKKIQTSPPAPLPAVRRRNRLVDSRPLPTTFAFNPEDLRLFIKYVAPADLKPPRRVLRKYSKRAMERMKRAIREFGFLIPIVADGKGRIIVGYRRWIAAKDLGLKLVPVIEVSHLSDEQLRMLRILDNKLCEDGEWDLDELRVEFGEFTDLCFNVDINIEDTGFSTAEIDNQLIAAATGEDPEPEDVIPEAPQVVVTRAGDVWQMGNHRLICGNSL